MEVALDAGYKHIDGAWVYFNEDEVGEAIQKKLADNTIKREDLFVTTKVSISMKKSFWIPISFFEAIAEVIVYTGTLVLIHFSLNLDIMCSSGNFSADT